MHTNERKTALVSGANTGVGFQIAKALADNGYTVYLVSRNLKKEKRLLQPSVALLKPFNCTLRITTLYKRQ